MHPNDLQANTPDRADNCESLNRHDLLLILYSNEQIWTNHSYRRRH